MKAIIFDGNEFAAKREKVLKKKISGFNFVPKIASVFFAEDEGSVRYTSIKQKVAERIGIHFHPEELSLETPLSSIIQVVRHYSNDEEFHGVMVQKPVQGSVSEVEEVGELGFSEWWRRIVEEININKDVDCLHPVNLERVYRGNWKVLPATVKAVIEILLDAGIDIKTEKVVVVGRSELAGKPLAHVLAQKGAQVDLCGSSGLAARNIGSQFTNEVEPMDLADVTKGAGILVSATGRQGLITGEMVKEGVVVIDVGAPLGDVDFDSVKLRAGFITPVPGGVGPVTVISLLENLVEKLS